MQKKPLIPARILLLGGIILDRYFEVERYPSAGGDTLIQNSYDRVGGCCLNVAITLQNLGGIPYIVTQVGDDEAGQKINEYIETQGLPPDCMLPAPGKSTGYCLTILEHSGERTFFTYKGCEAEFPLHAFPAGTFDGFTFAYITGYYLLHPQTALQVLALAKTLRQGGCQVLFDPGALVSELDAAYLRELLQCADWLVPNANELAIIREKLGAGEDFPTWLFDQGVRGLVIKSGAGGVELHSPGFDLELKGLSIQCKDSTGAGDSFAGGLIHGLIYGSSLPEAAALGNACGAYTCTLVGPHGRFTLPDIQNLIASSKELNL